MKELRTLLSVMVFVAMVWAGCSGTKPVTPPPTSKPATPATPSTSSPAPAASAAPTGAPAAAPSGAPSRPGGADAAANAMKPYKDVITAKAKTDEGMFKVHELDGKWFYEIPDSLMNREMLWVTRIAKTVDKLGYGGEQPNQGGGVQVVRWQKMDKKILLRTVGYSNIASEEKPIAEAVKSSNFEPIIKTFDIKSLNKDSTGVVIDVTSLFNTDVTPFGLPSNVRTQFQVRRLDPERTLILWGKSFPQNIEVRHILTYDAGAPPSQNSTGTISLEMNQSMILLAKKPMMPRISDNRVGYFGRSWKDYGTEAHKAETKAYIDRWRLEPKDMAAFKRGELVEPKKPIVYYLDPATPEKWRPYLCAGVEDWNVAFAEAGFKNAIKCKYPPTKEEDPEFSPEDVRYSVIRYFASDIENAYGPHISDPRSGEILESDIGWYHNVMNLLRNWFLVQTAAVNPDARTTRFKDEIMGQLIRFVSSHEVGHTLGLPHNMGSSSSTPVDSLRSAAFTKKYNLAHSIMDYARFNYVAQPEDKGVNLFPGIGVYDKYSIRWGYRPIPDAKTPEEELPVLNQWIRNHENDPRYRYGKQGGFDPSSQTEDLGDDAMKASDYGIKNLKRIMPNIQAWSNEPGKDYDDLEELYGQVIGQWGRYMGHVLNNIGGVTETYKSTDQSGVVYKMVDADKQRRAMQFLQKECFTTPTWMINTDYARRFEGTGMMERIRTRQVGVLNQVLDPVRIGRLLEASTLNENNYTASELMGDVRKAVWSELTSGGAIDMYRRNLQRGYLDRANGFMNENLVPTFTGLPQGFNPAKSFGIGVNMSQSDLRALMRGELNKLKSDIQSALGKTRDEMTRLHLQDSLERIDKIFNPEGK